MMINEKISMKQFICIVALFIFGSSGIFGGSNTAEQDSWITLIIGAIFSLPIIIAYARIIKLFPEKNIFDILEELFGKIISKIFIVLITWYAINLGALVIRNFSEFIKIIAMPETPELVSMISITLVIAYFAKSGVSTLGKWSVLILTIVAFSIILTSSLSVKYYDYNNILPILEHSSNNIIGNSLKLFSFPFAETVLFLALASSLKKSTSSYKSYLFGILAGFIILMMVFLRNILILGPELINVFYFPSFMAVRIIEIGDFLTRIEGTITINYLFAGLTKAAVCLLAASFGFAKLFEIKNYKKVVWPVSFLMLALCSVFYNTIIEMMAFMDVYFYYAFPFQVIIPLIIWITAEIKNMRNKNKNRVPIST